MVPTLFCITETLETPMEPPEPLLGSQVEPRLRLDLCSQSAILVTQEAETGRSQKRAWGAERIQAQYEQLSKTLAQSKRCKKDCRSILVGDTCQGV